MMMMMMAVAEEEVVMETRFHWLEIFDNWIDEVDENECLLLNWMVGH
jgi:hypothetical protein